MRPPGQDEDISFVIGREVDGPITLIQRIELIASTLGYIRSAEYFAVEWLSKVPLGTEVNFWRLVDDYAAEVSTFIRPTNLMFGWAPDQIRLVIAPRYYFGKES